MRVIYDHEANVLRLITDTPAATAASLLDDPGIAVELATDDGHDIVGLMVMGASAYIPLGKCKSYDAASDTLLLGLQTTSPDLITENGDFVGYWHRMKTNRTASWTRWECCSATHQNTSPSFPA